MSDTKKRHVGLMIYVRIQGVLCAILQKRGEWNHEKLGRESWAGGCQPTVHGKVNEGEADEWALSREALEEIGICPRGITFLKSTDDGAYFVALLDGPDEIADFRLGPSTGGLKIISAEDFKRVVDLRDWDKADYVSNVCIAMFRDDAEFVMEGFDHFASA